MEGTNDKMCTCGQVHNLDEVHKLTEYIWEGLRRYSKETPIDRHMMANAFFQVCAYFFIEHSPQSLPGQIEEIENFSKALLDTAHQNAPSLQ
jgi:hypothetical protein